MRSACEILGIEKPNENYDSLFIAERKKLFFAELPNCFNVLPLWCNPKTTENLQLWFTAATALKEYYCTEEGFVEHFVPKYNSLLIYHMFKVFEGEIYETEYNASVPVGELISKYFSGLKLREVFPTYNSK